MYNLSSLKPSVLSTLQDMRVTKLSPIQEACFTHLLENKSAIITSQTGSGKTLLYITMLINAINNDDGLSSFIILPTKELAQQVYEKCLVFNKRSPFPIKCLLINAQNANKQDIEKQHIIIGTPLHILELVKSNKATRNIQHLVFDEVDMLLDNGFFNFIDQILSLTYNKTLQIIACSATAHLGFVNQLNKYLGNTRVFSITSSIWTNSNIIHDIIYGKIDEEPSGIIARFFHIINPFCCLIFTNSTNEAIALFKKLKSTGKSISLLYGDLPPRERKKILKKLVDGKIQYLITTDVIARGFDLPIIDCVMSVGLPQDRTWYVNRVGRLGRFNKAGHSFLIYQKNDNNGILSLEQKGIKWNWYQLNNYEIRERPLNISYRSTKVYLDTNTNNQIKKIIGQNKKVRPGYKKKIARQIHRIKQRLKHEFITKSYYKKLHQEQGKKNGKK